MSEARSWRGAAGASLLAAAYALALLWPVLRAPSSTVPMDAGDPILNASILHWNATQLPLTREWWNFPAFEPARGVTTFTEHLLGLWPLASPVIWITGDAIVAYNVVFFLSFVLNAGATYLLVRELTGSGAGALVAAIAFSFNGYRVAQFSHIQVLMTWGMPLALLGMHRYLTSGRTAALLMAGAGWLVTGLSNGYFLVFFSVYCVCWALWFCTPRTAWRRVPGFAAAAVLAPLPLLPILVRYQEVHTRFDLQRSLEEIRSFSAGVGGVLTASPHGEAVSWLPRAYGEGALFPGFAVLVLGVVGVTRRVKTGGPPHGRWIARAAAAGAAAFAVATLVAASTDIRIEAPVRLSISDPLKPLRGLIVCLAAWSALSPGVRTAFARRDAALFYALTALLMWLLTLGPDAIAYAWLMQLPGVDGLRVPARAWMLALLSLSVLAGVATARVGRRRTIAAAAIAAVLLVEARANVDAAAVPDRGSVSPLPPGAIVLELPFGNVTSDIAAQFRAVIGGYRTVNGYSGHAPPHVGPLRAGLELRDGSVLTELRREFGFYVSVRATDDDGYRSFVVRTQSDARPIDEHAGRVLYDLPALPAISEGEIGAPVRFTVAFASCEPHLAKSVSDGRLDTRWQCGPARPGQQIVVDAGQAAPISGVSLALGPFTADAPRRLLIESSTDGSSWSDAFSGATFGYAVRAILADSRRADMHLRFEPRSARYLRLTQTGSATDLYWSVAELTVHGEWR